MKRRFRSILVALVALVRRLPPIPVAGPMLGLPLPVSPLPSAEPAASEEPPRPDQSQPASDMARDDTSPHPLAIADTPPAVLFEKLTKGVIDGRWQPHEAADALVFDQQLPPGWRGQQIARRARTTSTAQV